MGILSSFLPGISPYLIGGALLSGVVSGSYVTHKLDISAQESALKEQESMLIGQCNDDKAKTERIDNELQGKVTDLSKRVAEYRRMHKTSTCVPITNTASSDNGKTGSGLVGANAIASESLTEYAELAESYRLRLVSCQNFIRLERLP